MANKGYVNKETQILADNAVAPYIHDDAGIVDLVTTYIDEIIEDKADIIFNKRDVIDGMNVPFRLILDETNDGETLSYVLNNLNLSRIYIKFTNNVAVTEPVPANITINNILISSTPMFMAGGAGVTNIIDCSNDHGFLNIIRNYPISITGYASAQLYPSFTFSNGGNILKLNINLGDAVAGTNIKIWGY